MALIAREGAEVKVLLKNVFPNLIEAPSVEKEGGEVAPQESHEKRSLSSSTSAFPPLSCPGCSVPGSKSHLSLWPWGHGTFVASPPWGRAPAPQEKGHPNSFVGLPLCNQRVSLSTARGIAAWLICLSSPPSDPHVALQKSFSLSSYPCRLPGTRSHIHVGILVPTYTYTLD